jgi:class 3 adenylate cyclase
VAGVREGWLRALVAASALVLAALAVTLAARAGEPYPGFFHSLDYRVVPVDPGALRAGLVWGDRVVAVEGGSPLTLAARVAAAPEAVTYHVERQGRRLSLSVPSAPLTWELLAFHFAPAFVVALLMLAAGLLVYRQNPAARPNRYFLVYMCLWTLANVAAPEAVLGPDKLASPLMGVIPTFLTVHGWIFFLTYPSTPAREAWLARHRVVPRLYRAATVLALALTLLFGLAWTLAPGWLAEGPLYQGALLFQVGLAVVSFPIKIGALWDTRRRAASPLINQQTGVLLLGIALGLGGWLVATLLPLAFVYPPPVEPALGSALVLLYPAAIAYATLRYRLFDATLVIRRSVVYAVLAGLITGAYALAIASANLLLAQADLGRSPWFGLAFNPVRERVRRGVDRMFFRERADHVAAIQALARDLRTQLDLGEIARRLSSTIEATMHAREVRLLAGRELPDAAGPLARALDAAPGALSRYQVAADPLLQADRPAILGAYAALGAEVVVPLRFQEGLQGVLALGSKRAEAPYTDEDLALLETLADQAAVAVANAEAHRRVLDYARELERNLLIRTNLGKFVPQRVRELIEASPEAPSLGKREAEVTVLFADITGYTRLSSRLAPEDLDALVERYFGAFLDEIVRHGGDVNETAGDGLMAIFHEGAHPEAAVAAARAIHRRAAELNRELAGRAEPVAMHVGINTGLALLGATKMEGRAGTRWTYTASGLTTNIAARLAAVARGGEIVASEATRARLGGGTAAEDLGPLALKNVERPVRAFRLG